MRVGRRTFYILIIYVYTFSISTLTERKVFPSVELLECPVNLEGRMKSIVFNFTHFCPYHSCCQHNDSGWHAFGSYPVIEHAVPVRAFGNIFRLAKFIHEYKANNLG
jgi:hypothetical protein